MDDILLSNKYSRWYFGIIDKARGQNRRRKRDLYYERHHVLPVCLYPQFSKDEDNLVLLTAREHFVCHWLLTKMVHEKRHYQQLLNALGKMMQAAIWHERDIIRSGWRYEVCRKAHSKRCSIIMSEMHKGKTISPQQREKLRIASTGLRHTAEAKEKIAASKRGVPRSEETKEKLRRATVEQLKRQGHPNRGKLWSEEQRERRRAKYREFGHHMTGRKNPSPLVTCPHCGMTMSARPAGRWHFDKCKSKK